MLTRDDFKRTALVIAVEMTNAGDPSSWFEAQGVDLDELMAFADGEMTGFEGAMGRAMNAPSALVIGVQYGLRIRDQATAQSDD
jgi:hypothetical protein